MIPNVTREKKIVDSIVKCHKCKSKDLFLEELWKDHFIQWEQIDGKFDINDGVMEPGDPYKVIARCKKCNHVWTVRKITQIDFVTPETKLTP